jgi:hypothetical protein
MMECVMNLQTYSETTMQSCNHSPHYAQTGNTITISLIMHVLHKEAIHNNCDPGTDGNTGVILEESEKAEK